MATELRVRVEFSDDKSVAILCMQHDDNRVVPGFLRDFNNALDLVEKNPSVKALITTGEGKFFSNGFDLDEIISLPEEEQTKFWRNTDKLLGRLLVFPVVTIAALNGHTFGMGVFLALAHDYRVMRSDRGYFCLPEIHLGMQLPPPYMGLARTKLPSSEHIPCIVLGKRYTGEKALKTGIVHKTASNTELMDTALTLAREAVGKEKYDRELLSKMKQDLYTDIHKYLNEPQLSSKI